MVLDVYNVTCSTKPLKLCNQEVNFELKKIHNHTIQKSILVQTKW
jgi:hypothetical protein